MVNVTRGGSIDLGGSVPSMPNFRLAGSRLLKIGLAILILLLLLWSTTSIPTGNVGVLTLFGRVTGETLPEGIHLINPLKSVQKLSVQTQSVKESANVPSNEGQKSWNLRYARQFALRLPRTPRMRCTPMRANWCRRKSRMS